jgi:hypothetical protein
MATKVPDVSFEKMEPQPVIIWQVTSAERAIRKHPCRKCCDDRSARADILACPQEKRLIVGSKRQAAGASAPSSISQAQKLSEKMGLRLAPISRENVISVLSLTGKISSIKTRLNFSDSSKGGLCAACSKQTIFCRARRWRQNKFRPDPKERGDRS